jgi:hypothetical protein
VQLTDRIEKRRFVGREFLLWLWFESEVLEGTLSTEEHGPIGLWLEKQLVLSAGKVSTRIKAEAPGAGREAKEALLSGQLPESAGIRVALGEQETSFVLKADQMAVASLKLQTVLGKEEDAQPMDLVRELTQRPRARRGRADEASDEAHEAFYERMRMTADFEHLLETLYADFLALRLNAETWHEVASLMRAWAEGRLQSPERYLALKAPRRRKRTSAGR